MRPWWGQASSSLFKEFPHSDIRLIHEHRYSKCKYWAHSHTLCFTSILHSTHTHQSSQSLQESLIRARGRQTHRAQSLCACFMPNDPGLWMHNVKFTAFLQHFPCDRAAQWGPLCPERECVRVRLWCHSQRAFRRLLLSVSQLLSHHLVVLEEGRREKGTSVHPVSQTVCVCVCVCWVWKGKKRGIGHCLKIQISQSWWGDEAQGKTEKKTQSVRNVQKERNKKKSERERNKKWRRGKQGIQGGLVDLNEALAWILNLQ